VKDFAFLAPLQGDDQGEIVTEGPRLGVDYSRRLLLFRRITWAGLVGLCDKLAAACGLALPQRAWAIPKPLYQAARVLLKMHCKTKIILEFI